MQATASMIVPGSSPSTSDDGYNRGMSDEEELRRAGLSAQTEGLGEVLVDFDDASELGLRAEPI